MVQTVFVHIGTMKSATTYLQGLFDRNAETLADAGVRWLPSAESFLALADFRGTQDVGRPGRAGAWLRLLDSVRQHDGDVLLSNELLAPLGMAKIERLSADLAPADLQVIVTARDLARVIPSHWQTTLKNGSTIGWKQFAAAVCQDAAPADDTPGSQLWSWFWRRHDLPEIARRWRRGSGASRVHVVTVPRAASDPGAVASRFAEALGFALPALRQPEFVNSSLGAHSAELLRRLNHETGERTRTYYRWGIKEGLAVALGGQVVQEPAFGLTEQQYEWVHDRARRLVEQAAALGALVHGDLVDLQPPPLSTLPAWVDPATSDDSSLLATALCALGDLVSIAGDLGRDRELRARS